MEFENVLICFLILLTSNSISKKQQLSLQVEFGDNESHNFDVNVLFGGRNSQNGRKGSLMMFDEFENKIYMSSKNSNTNIALIFVKETESNRGSPRNFLKDKILFTVEKFREIDVSPSIIVVISNTKLHTETLVIADVGAVYFLENDKNYKWWKSVVLSSSNCFIQNKSTKNMGNSVSKYFDKFMLMSSLMLILFIVLGWKTLHEGLPSHITSVHVFRAAKKIVEEMEETTSFGRNDQFETENGCSICLQQFVGNQPIRVLPCRHRYHSNCVDDWLIKKRRCPLCSYDILQNNKSL